MKKSVLNTSLIIAKKLAEKDCKLQRCRHFAFIVLRNEIIAIGENQDHRHPYQTQWGYPIKSSHGYSMLEHAEFNAIRRLNRFSLKGHELISLRLDRNDKWNMAKPCKYCERVIKSVGIENVYYSNSLGDIVDYRIY